MPCLTTDTGINYNSRLQWWKSVAVAFQSVAILDWGHKFLAVLFVSIVVYVKTMWIVTDFTYQNFNCNSSLACTNTWDHNEKSKIRSTFYILVNIFVPIMNLIVIICVVGITMFLIIESTLCYFFCKTLSKTGSATNSVDLRSKTVGIYSCYRLSLICFKGKGITAFSQEQIIHKCQKVKNNTLLRIVCICTTLVGKLQFKKLWNCFSLENLPLLHCSEKNHSGDILL